MCGRYSLNASSSSLGSAFMLEDAPELPPRFNIAPTQLAPVVREPVRGARELALLKWGLIPPWADDASLGARMINARAETVAEKPAFRTAFRKHRCLVPTTGFYEWQKAGGGKAGGKAGGKQPWLIHRADGGLFAFAGLWERWKSPEGEVIDSFTILTTDANDLVRSIHDRMPVVIAPEDYSRWLDPGASPTDLTALLRPAGEVGLEVYRISPRVNSPVNEGPELQTPWVPEG